MPAGGLDYGIAQTRQDFGRCPANGIVVVDDEHDRLTSPRLCSLVESDCGRLGLRRRARQADVNRRTLARCAVDAHVATGLMGRAEDLRQAEARAGARTFGSEERLERLGLHLRRHAASDITHRDRDVVTLSGFFGTKRWPAMHVGRFHGHDAAFRHGVACVDHQVEHDELKLRRIDHGGPQIRREARFDLDPRAQSALQQTLHARYQCIHIDCARGQRLAPGKGEQMTGQHGAPLSCGAHRRQPVDELRIERRRLSDQIDVADQHGQQIVEIVRDAPGELTYRFDALGLAQRRLGPLALRHLFDEPLVRVLCRIFGGAVLAEQHLNLARALRQQQQQTENSHRGANRH